MQSHSDQIAGTGDDHEAWGSSFRRYFILTASLVIATAAYAGALILKAPAGVLRDRLPDNLDNGVATGTVFSGRIVAGDGLMADWSISALRSLGAAKLVGRWQLSGPAMMLDGEVRLSAKTVSLRAISGRLNAAIFSDLDLPIAQNCNFDLRVDIVQLDAWAGSVRGEGAVQTGEIICADREIAPVTMHIQPTDEGSSFRLSSAADDPGKILAFGAIRPDRRFAATVTTEGVEMFSGQIDSGPIEVEYRW